MKHIRPATKSFDLPARASLLEVQQKIAVFSTFVAALGTFAETAAAYSQLAAKE